MIKYLQLPSFYLKEILKQEADQLKTHYWKEHYNKRDYDGSWTILPLRSISGNAGNIFAKNAGNTAAPFKDTPYLQYCPAISSLLDSFKCNLFSVRLMRLHKGALIKEHADNDLNFEQGEIRIHLPIYTNPDVYFYLNGERIIMNEGECWYLNLSLPHSVENRGNTDRIHLVIDAEVNDWVNNWFAAPLRRKDEELPKIKYSDADKQNIIAQLKLLHTPTSLAMANKMEKEL